MKQEEYKNFLEYLGEEYPDSIYFSNPEYSGAIVGLSTDGRVVYNYRKMVEDLMEDMTEEEAIEFIDYNTIRSLPYAGEKAPIVMYDIEDFEEF